ncbi:phosphoglycerate dehydrogenase [Woodsholea maritima]|uniref:phosphoglycerate dehydrogenase n=1 Tax=Woodsholea maritima TaxID=240237 RepID=UPI000375209C|nr:phosphoglycerate dehydrogenase [Woodsholea maritima]
MSALPNAPHALFLENLHDDADRAINLFGPVSVTRLASSPERAQLEADLQTADVIGIRSRTHIDGALLDLAPNLLAVGCFCIGTNQVELEEAAKRGVPVFNAPFANTRSVAELTMASIIMLMRRIPEKMFAIHESGGWLKTAEGSHEVRKKKLGIVGYGNIGAQLSVIASALGMHVYYYDVEPKLAHGNARPTESLDELLSLADVVTLHVPDTAQTRGMIRAEHLAKMKKGSFLINHARGQLVDIDALTEALKSEHLAGAAIDVFPKEPKGKDEAFDSPLRQFKNIILTPHIGGSTLEAQAAIGEDSAMKLAKYLYQGATNFAVNFPNIEPGPIKPGNTRLTVSHLNAPGFLSRLNEKVSNAGLNITAQFLQTQGDLGYAIADMEGAMPHDFQAIIEGLDGAIRVRLIGQSA